MRHFVAGPENHFAVAAYHCLLENPHCSYSPLVIHGSAGVGKSHVARAIARTWQRKHGARTVLVTTSDQFVQQLKIAVQSQSTAALRTRYRSAELLILEEIHRLPPTPCDAHYELIGTLDTLHDRGAKVVITSRLPVGALRGIPRQLISRLRSGLVLLLAPPTSTARLEILRQAARQLDISIPENRLRLLADTTTGTVPHLVEAFAQFATRLPTSGARLPKPDDPPTETTRARNTGYQAPLAAAHTTRILAITARHFRLSPARLRSNSRRYAIVHARRTAIYLVRRLTGQSYQAIGRRFGNRDHTTVLYNYQKIERLLQTDAHTRATIDHLTEAILHSDRLS